MPLDDQDDSAVESLDDDIRELKHESKPGAITNMQDSIAFLARTVDLKIGDEDDVVLPPEFDIEDAQPSSKKSPAQKQQAKTFNM